MPWSVYFLCLKRPVRVRTSLFFCSFLSSVDAEPGDIPSSTGLQRFKGSPGIFLCQAASQCLAHFIQGISYAVTGQSAPQSHTFGCAFLSLPQQEHHQKSSRRVRTRGRWLPDDIHGAVLTFHQHTIGASPGVEFSVRVVCDAHRSVGGLDQLVPILSPILRHGGRGEWAS